ncbi:hypothetical protein [Acinetobacter sp. ANC 5378]|uniref:phage adaptor protein n=1 Tax=Acinetobacter sp. ANC 5378 TaxID=2731249 RepID=UPI0014900695|nr:hypothetical protein [Acinetobacter sp. ANC 5378]NNG80614.1 hypothetical protein [Acinetobacter sp. ANC 5378]
MDLNELRRRFRVEASDLVEPYFNSTEDVDAWLNDAVREACIRGRLLHESEDTTICRIEIIAGQAQYPLDSRIYELTHLRFDLGDGQCEREVKLASEEILSHRYHSNWRTRMGDPEHAIQSDTGLRLVPRPEQDGTLIVEGYRLPLVDMVEDTDQPEINQAHHAHLVQWALHKAFSVPDTEFMDPNRAQIAEYKFIDYFGDRPDSNLRREVREDFEHHVTPFWP